MTRTRFPAAVLLILLLSAPLVLAAASSLLVVPDDAERSEVGPSTALTWVSGPGETTALAPNLTAGTNGTLYLVLDLHENGTYNATWSVTAGTGAELRENGTLETGNFTVANATADNADTVRSVPFHVPANATGTASFTVDVTLHELQERNGTGNDTANATTTWEQVGTGTLTPTVEIVQPPHPSVGPEDGPNWLLIGAVGAVVAVGAAGGYAVYKRRQGPTAPRRSRALQELEAEQARKPEAREQAMEEAREAQAQAQQSRELQILEAKANDHRRGIELARKRMDQGEITEHQFQRIKGRKEEALEDVLEEIEDLRQDG